MEHEDFIKLGDKIKQDFTIARKKVGPNNQRATIIGEFEKEINQARIADGRRPLPSAFFGTKLAHLKDKRDLYYFLSLCRQAKNFSKCFWGSLKVKK